MTVTGSGEESRAPIARLVYGNEADVPETPRPGRNVRHFVGVEDGAQKLSAGVVVFPPRTDSVPHMHDVQEEVLYVVAGTGQLVCEGRSLPLSPGAYVFVPPGVSHFVRNDGDQDIKFFYAFSPPGIIGTW